MLPKLHKSKEINKIIAIKHTEYIQIDKDVLMEGQPIVAHPVFHTSGVSEILHCIMEPPYLPQSLSYSHRILD